MSLAFVQSEWTFYAIRFLLGVFEAGFFPGVVLYLTYWFPSAKRSRINGLFMTIPTARRRGSSRRAPTGW
jgi:MFS family permease